MNLKQILKTVVRALMTFAAIRTVDAQYNMPVTCPTTNPERCDLPISGKYFTEHGLFVEGNTAIIDDIAWKVSSAFGESSSRISSNVPYYLMEHANEIKENVAISESTNMEIFVPVVYYPSKINFNGRIECTYQTNQTNTKHESESIAPRFTLQTKPCTIYQPVRPEQQQDLFLKLGTVTKWYGQLPQPRESETFYKYICTYPQPKGCKVMATFGDCNPKPKSSFFKAEQNKQQPKNQTQTANTSACLML